MSKEFIEKRVGSQSIAEARMQQKDLAYFTQSSIQKPITTEYLKQYVSREYAGNDEFLNWVKTIFAGDNFLSFYKYLSFPAPSANIVNNKIRPQLERVFFSEDSHFQYIINGEEVEAPKSLDSVHFSEEMLNAMMFRHNDILITDLKDVNTPFRNLVSIDNVVSIESSRSVIKRLAYTASISILNDIGETELVDGYLYMDDIEYSFYNKELVLVLNEPHDLGQCPADYIVPEPFSNDDIVRKSIFSFVNPKLKEYSFLTTLQRMTDPNGVVPVTAILKFKEDTEDELGSEDVDGSDKIPAMQLAITSQQSKIQREVVGKANGLAAGTIHHVKPRLLDSGAVDSIAVQNYIKFYHMPVEAMKHLNERILEIENDIIQSVTGDFKEQNEAAQNEKQVSKGYISKEDSLRKVSKGLSRIVKRSDEKMLGLEFGPDNIRNTAFFGTDFFPETQNELYEIFAKAPNPIERKNTLLRIIKTKNRFNKENSLRQNILYSLQPYAADVDFQTAIDTQQASPEIIQLQTRFNSWIDIFEAKYGDLLSVWEGLGEISNAEKRTIINNLILQEVRLAIVPPAPPEKVA